MLSAAGADRPIEPEFGRPPTDARLSVWISEVTELVFVDLSDALSPRYHPRAMPMSDEGQPYPAAASAAHVNGSHVLFVVSRDAADRYRTLKKLAVDNERLTTIFDRRRDRRVTDRACAFDRRKRNRRTHDISVELERHGWAVVRMPGRLDSTPTTRADGRPRAAQPTDIGTFSPHPNCSRGRS